MQLISKLFRITQEQISRNVRQISWTSRNCNRKLMNEEVFRRKKQQTYIGPFGWFLLTIPAATFGLGTWQVQRKQWKENLIKQMKDRVNTTPVPLPESMEEIERLEYYPVHVKGHFLHDKELYMGPRTLLAKGDASTTSGLMSKNQMSQGYLVITPFKLADRDVTILVNRGWVAAKNKRPETRTAGQVQEVVDVIGIVRLQENRPNFMPNNNINANSWFYRDLDCMSDVTGSSPIFIDATNDFDAIGGPVGGQTRISIRNEHLSYIFTWYSLCAVTSWMWVKQFVKKR
ncbi:PREDICTED: surfeit locus protein 1 [Nicrophorus vespilloides]|uniref:SURF1-like protein n=1 Tax=Nicrophorus vespilloides TaxID=110193 RepID=A0ABM1MND6_NICVS|nr:PREDICTED: surfeit locus protein 1 [Nicrophorus vespilloides]XP_017776086.1 PREDICTED: surfeit locus protein 1 [Nicrophorus vespilloides]